MQLNLSQIKEITCGACNVLQEQEGIRFCRFTEEQFALYEKKSEKFFLKSKTPAGVKLSFRTDSKSMYLEFFVGEDVGASFISFDIFVNGVMVRSLDNFSAVEIPRNYLKTEFPLGKFSGEILLGEGEKTVTVHLPWNGIVYLQEMRLDDGASIVPVKPERKLLALGDSITYGNAAMHPSHRYVAKLCDALGAEEFNKGIGGEFFCPDLAATREPFVPDYIIVAYGTNDWRKTSRETFFANVNGFFRALNETYPRIQTIVITPTWRSNLHVETDFDSFMEIDAGIREAAAGRENTMIVNGYDLIPHDVAYFGDYGCHPNEKGFEMYFQNLWRAISE